MTTSEHEGLVLYTAEDLDTDEPADTLLVRVALNNALHLADQAGQHRGGWVALNPDLGAGPDGVRLHDPEGGELALDQWYVFPGPRPMFAPKVRADSSGYRARVWLSGYLEGEGGAEADFAVMLVPALERRIASGFRLAWPVKFVTAVTPSDSAVLVPFDDATHYIDVPSTLIAAALGGTGTSWSTREDLGGPHTSVAVPALEAVALARVTNAGTSEYMPVLTGLHVSEYLGP